METLPRSEWFEPQIGCPIPVAQHWEDKSPRLVETLVGLTGGLWEAWTPLMRSMHTLAYSPNGEEKAD